MTSPRWWSGLGLAVALTIFAAGAGLAQTPATGKGAKSTPKAEAPPAKAADVERLEKAVAGLQADLTLARQAMEGLEAKANAAKDSADAAKKSAATAAEDAKKAATPPPAPPAPPTPEAPKPAPPSADTGDTAWMLTSSALVMFMLPGLALFYAGMVRRKNVLATMMQSMACLAVVGLYWVAFGYGLAFGPSAFSITADSPLSFLGEGGVIGWSWDLFFLKGVETTAILPGYKIPVYTHVMFQGMFAIITPALISGAVAERIRFWPFCIFSILWITLVYCPLAHMVWAYDWFTPEPTGLVALGVLGKMVALDFAGGTVVHIAAGAAGLAACLVLRRREGYPKTVIHPNSMVLTLLGAGLLWFGWFGFNGGSATGSGTLASSAFAATQAAAAAAGLGWILVEWLLKGKPTALGLASGVVAGLVAVTPASGFIYVWGGAAIGLAAGVLCYFAVALKNALGYDDSLDAFGIHGVGGFLGAVLTGLFCYTTVNAAGADGYFAVKGQEARVVQLPELIAAAKRDEAAATDEKVKPFKTAAVASLEDELKATGDKIDKRKTDGKGPLSQFKVQLFAAAVAAVLAFVISALLVALTQAMTLGNFRTSRHDETDGLDRTEHGEVGFDFGYASESVAVGQAEPRAASMPKPATGRFDLMVEGVPAEDIAQLWTGLCQPGDKPASADFQAVYKSVTTFRGNRFHCRGGDAPAVAQRLESLFKKLLPGRAIKVVRL